MNNLEENPMFYYRSKNGTVSVIAKVGNLYSDACRKRVKKVKINNIKNFKPLK